LLKNLKLEINDMDGFVVSEGPGSFTGLRIGAAAVKGLSQGVGRPFAGVSTLDSLAYNMAWTSGIVCPVLDALRGNVYSALYKFEKGDLERLSDYLVLSLEELVELLNEKREPVCFVGDAVPLYKDILQEKIMNASFAPANLNLARASALGELGMIKLKNNEFEGSSFAPFYLRKSQAEREYDKKQEMNNGKA
jgi:tRNA threonylcarbamoyl adenosine modification protein YeaZ